MGKLNYHKMMKMTDTEKQQRVAEAAAVMQFVQKAPRNISTVPAKLRFSKIKHTNDGFAALPPRCAA